MESEGDVRVGQQTFGRAGDGVSGWADVAAQRYDRAPLSFNGILVQRHARRFQADLILELTLWRRRLTGFVIGYPILVPDPLESGWPVASDAVLVESLAEAMMFIEDLCCYPLPQPPFLSAPDQLLSSLIAAQRRARFLQVFNDLAGQALADWALLEPDAGLRRNAEQVHP